MHKKTHVNKKYEGTVFRDAQAFDVCVMTSSQPSCPSPTLALSILCNRGYGAHLLMRSTCLLTYHPANCRLWLNHLISLINNGKIEPLFLTIYCSGPLSL